MCLVPTPTCPYLEEPQANTYNDSYEILILVFNIKPVLSLF
jgi:hypothetical protein